MERGTVIIPTYNRVSTLSRAINSVLRQTHEEFELLVVDDGSTDATPRLMQMFDDDRLQYIRTEENKGVSAARNIGIERATGEWYVLLDSDDELLPNAIETLVETLQSGPHVWVTASDIVIYSEGVIKPRLRREQEVTLGDLVLPSSRSQFGGTSGGIVDADAISEAGLFDEALELLEDHDLFLRLAERHPLYCTSQSVLLTHKTAEDRLTSESAIYARRDSIRRFLDKHESTLSTEFIGEEHYRLGHICARAGNRTEAAIEFKRALEQRPLTLKYLLYSGATAWNEAGYARLSEWESAYKDVRRTLNGTYHRL